MKMQNNLERKNLYYSILLAVLLLLLLVGYFSFMIPSLYLNHMMERNLEHARAQHETYVQTGSFAQIRVDSPLTSIGLRMPLNGEVLYFDSKKISAKITPTDPRMKELFQELADLAGAMKREQGEAQKESQEESQTKEQTAKILKDVQEILKRAGDNMDSGESSMADLEFFYDQDWETEFHNESIRYYEVGQNGILAECGIEDKENRYTSYISMEQTGDMICLSLLATMTPDMNEIRPVVWQSLPMLGAVILLLVLIFSRVYSKGIVSPMVSLSEELNETIRQNCRELEEKNEELKEENRRQEVFLRASSHQLKTPVSAALLLVDGMIHKVGKYQDTEQYLPQVKSELLSMRKMVEEILYLNHCGEELHIVPVPLRTLCEEKLSGYRVEFEKRKLRVEWTQKADGVVNSDENVLGQILDNLISNAVKYTPEGGKIRFVIQENELRIENEGDPVPKEILDHIFDPFVTSNTAEKGHGLGLYIAAFYAKKLSIELSITNESYGISARLRWKEALSLGKYA